MMGLGCGLWVMAALGCAASASAAGDVETPLSALYERAAADLKATGTLRMRVYVALCDNDSQGIAPVKNRAICDGERPERNLYWATSGGLRAYLEGAGFRRTRYERSDAGPVIIRAAWTKRMWPGGRLRALGVKRRFDVEIEALAYRGRHIEQAMRDYLAEVHGAAASPAPAHVVGYIGHNYLLDLPDAGRRLQPVGGLRADSRLPRAVFALSCFGAQLIGPAIARPDAPVLVLNRSLTYPGAWTIGGLLEGLGAGLSARGIHRRASRHFARGKKKPPGSMMRVFAYGPTARAQ